MKDYSARQSQPIKVTTAFVDENKILKISIIGESELKLSDVAAGLEGLTKWIIELAEKSKVKT